MATITMQFNIISPGGSTDCVDDDAIEETVKVPDEDLNDEELNELSFRFSQQFRYWGSRGCIINDFLLTNGEGIPVVLLDDVGAVIELESVSNHAVQARLTDGKEGLDWRIATVEEVENSQRRAAEKYIQIVRDETKEFHYVGKNSENREALEETYHDFLQTLEIDRKVDEKLEKTFKPAINEMTAKIDELNARIEELLKPKTVEPLVVAVERAEIEVNGMVAQVETKISSVGKAVKNIVSGWVESTRSTLRGVSRMFSHVIAGRDDDGAEKMGYEVGKKTVDTALQVEPQQKPKLTREEIRKRVAEEDAFVDAIIAKIRTPSAPTKAELEKELEQNRRELLEINSEKKELLRREEALATREKTLLETLSGLGAEQASDGIAWSDDSDGIEWGTSGDEPTQGIAFGGPRL